MKRTTIKKSRKLKAVPAIGMVPGDEKARRLLPPWHLTNTDFSEYWRWAKEQLVFLKCSGCGSILLLSKDNPKWALGTPCPGLRCRRILKVTTGPILAPPIHRRQRRQPAASGDITAGGIANDAKGRALGEHPIVRR